MKKEAWDESGDAEEHDADCQKAMEGGIAREVRNDGGKEADR